MTVPQSAEMGWGFTAGHHIGKRPWLSRVSPGQLESHNMLKLMMISIFLIVATLSANTGAIGIEPHG